MMLDYFLSQENTFKFFSFKSGEECLENLHLKPNLIILDYGLPGLNGYETFLELKKRAPEVRIVVLTSNDDVEVATRFLKDGADDYILKEGAGEAQIIEKIETFIAEEEIAKGKSYKDKLIYFILIITLLTLGIIWYGI